MVFEPPSRLVIATHNDGKFREFVELLRAYVPDIVSAKQLNLPSPEETGSTFEENALIKARAAAQASGCMALADDSGLCVNALGGRPGIFSARWVEDRNFQTAFGKLQKELGDSPDRSAYFACVLTLCQPDGTCESVEGRVDGTLAREARGTGGHGYDPLFIPTGYTQTFAEMDEKQKNALSHRGRAARALVERFFVQHKSTC
ncbi:MAG: RdgB/HAM1 family non-canonical purine NTP pyrophosphatase [Alphaproteobacteria bacterium]|nr:RdgB/HAM1 family non-canonical purine NTP pyrophosphatase [Alphaproteobacteria bacterium]